MRIEYYTRTHYGTKSIYLEETELSRPIIKLIGQKTVPLDKFMALEELCNTIGWELVQVVSHEDRVIGQARKEAYSNKQGWLNETL